MEKDGIFVIYSSFFLESSVLSCLLLRHCHSSDNFFLKKKEVKRKIKTL